MAGRQSVTALGVVTAVAVLREGSEVVLFLYGIVLQGSDTAFDLVIGSACGLALGAAVSAVLYLGLTIVPIHRLFTVTGVLVTLVAAGLAAEAAHQLTNAGLVGSDLSAPLWDTSWLLPEDSMAGRVLHALAGYRESPSLIELAAYVSTILVISLLSAGVKRAAPQKRAAAAR